MLKNMDKLEFNEVAIEDNETMEEFKRCLKIKYGDSILREFDSTLKDPEVTLRSVARNHSKTDKWAQMVFKVIYGKSYKELFDERRDSKKRPDKAKTSFIISIPYELHKRLRKHAKAHSMTVNGVMVDIISDLLDGDGWNRSSFF